VSVRSIALGLRASWRGKHVAEVTDWAAGKQRGVTGRPWTRYTLQRHALHPLPPARPPLLQFHHPSLFTF
jgi:hypothetical protein